MKTLKTIAKIENTFPKDYGIMLNDKLVLKRLTLQQWTCVH